MSRIKTAIFCSLCAAGLLAPNLATAGPSEDYNTTLVVAGNLSEAVSMAPPASAQASCIKSQAEQAAQVSNDAEDQLALFNDPASSPEVKEAAAAQLAALAAVANGLVETSSNVCEGMAVDADDPTDTDEDAPGTIPLLDPTSGLGTPTDLPPAVDNGWPQVGSPSA